MHTSLCATIRPSRTLAALVAAAGLVVIGGCKSGSTGETSMQSGNTNSSAVTAPNTSHVGQDASSFDTMRTFPTGDKSSSVLMIEAMGPSSIHMQHEATYQIKVTNLTNMPVRGVTVSSTNPDGFQTTGVSNATTQPDELRRRRPRPQ